MISNIAIATYSHDAVSDVWPMYFGQLKKHIDFIDSHYFFSNVDSFEGLSSEATFLKYNEDDPYWKKYCDCLGQVNEKYVIVMYEDEILYRPAKEKDILKYIDFLEKTDYGFVRLIRSDVHDENYIDQYDDILHINPNQHYFFSMQPTIWKREDLLKCVEDSHIEIIFEEMKIGNSLRKFGVKGACVYKGEEMAGKNHYYSDTFPLVEVIAKGKWIGDYRAILEPLWKEYGIDPNVRGVK